MTVLRASPPLSIRISLARRAYAGPTVRLRASDKSCSRSVLLKFILHATNLTIDRVRAASPMRDWRACMRATRASAQAARGQARSGVLKYTLKRTPPDGSTHWSSRKLAAELGDVLFSAMQRIWRKHGVRPHRLDTHMVSNDPDFETKAADVIGLHLNPPAHAAVFCR